MSNPDTAIADLLAGREMFLDELKQFLAMPSVSTFPEHKADMERTAHWLADRLKRAGMQWVEVVPTNGHPMICAEWRGAPGRPTVLVYGHYDVQPADPIEEWVSPPFEPTVRGENLYARGASDMKGQILAQITAVEALTKQGPLPVNIKYLIEGEEEIGSPNLVAFMEKYRDRLKCDVVLNCDAGIHRPDLPAITYALRGLVYFELEIHGPKKDLHSGTFGGSVHNPIQVLCDLVSGMHDADGRVTLPGFYDHVRLLDEEERQMLARVPCTDEDWQKITGAPALWGEKGYTTVERVGARPTLEVNGITGGFTGQGAKTVLPAKALAKLSVRQVADQDPAAVLGQLRAYVRAHAPNTVTWELRQISCGPGAIMDRKSPYMRAAQAALKEVFGVAPIFKREGGSVPVAAWVQQLLGVDSVMLGFGLPDDGLHGPNEKQHLPTLYKGLDTYVRFLCNL